MEVQFEGFDTSPVLIVETTGADVMDGVVRAVHGFSVLVDGGAFLSGSSRSELVAALGTPTSTRDVSAKWGSGAELLVYEAGGYAYAALVIDDLVLDVQSGDPDWISDDQGCP